MTSVRFLNVHKALTVLEYLDLINTLCFTFVNKYFLNDKKWF